ncbi:MAG: hypothetical protein M0R46_09960 [Candidatus Muirbacterium halophilum]|nr:hypothetical protein [Candidatus Muirbacterium halophilum]
MNGFLVLIFVIAFVVISFKLAKKGGIAIIKKRLKDIYNIKDVTDDEAKKLLSNLGTEANPDIFYKNLMAMREHNGYKK